MMTASCINSAVCDVPSSYPRQMWFPWEAFLQLLEVCSQSPYHSPVRCPALVWGYPSARAEGKVWKLTVQAPTPENLFPFLLGCHLVTPLWKTTNNTCLCVTELFINWTPLLGGYLQLVRMVSGLKTPQCSYYR